MIPAGWTGQADGDPARFFSPDSTPQKYFSLEFFNPQTTNEDVLAHHNMIVNNLSGLKEPGTQLQSGILGQFIWTRMVIRRPQSQPETTILYSAKVGSLYILMDVDATGADLVARNLPVVRWSPFFRGSYRNIGSASSRNMRIRSVRMTRIRQILLRWDRREMPRSVWPETRALGHPARIRTTD
jgi:hypothetical protein